MMKAAIYARMSTHDQNAEMQLAELREYCGVSGDPSAARGVTGAPRGLYGIVMFSVLEPSCCESASSITSRMR